MLKRVLEVLAVLFLITGAGLIADRVVEPQCEPVVIYTVGAEDDITVPEEFEGQVDIR
jgi:hypothetical protein